MWKILPKIFPYFDYLYIYQTLEYNSWVFLRWFLRQPFKRNLQKKHSLDWSQKAQMLGLISLLLLFLDSIFTSYFITGSYWVGILLLPLKSLYFPLFLIMAQILLLPLEYFHKQMIINSAQKKLSKLNNLKIVAITGSYGKTSTKDILYTLLWKKFYVVKTPKSYNTFLGLSKTILDYLKPNTQIFIAEIGAYHRGDIKKLTKFLKPVLGIITAVGPQHLERFGSLENIAKAKFELAENLPANGTILLNTENKHLQTLASHFGSGNVVYFGDNSQYFATNIQITKEGTNFVFHTPKSKININIPLIGEHHVKNFVAASTAALNLGLSLAEIKERAKKLLPTPHRMEIKKMGNMILIDNSYNTNPQSAQSSIKLLDSFENSRKIVITPGFIELGGETAEANRKLGEEISCIADQIIIVGKYAKKYLLEGIKTLHPRNEEVYFVDSTQEGIQLAQQLTSEHIQQVARDDVVVVVLLENDLPDQYS